MKYKGNWSYATSFDDRCQINGIIATSDIPVDERTRLIIAMARIWKKVDKMLEKKQ
jgi:hypothetical protein